MLYARTIKTIQINQDSQALGEQFPAVQLVQADAKPI